MTREEILSKLKTVNPDSEEAVELSAMLIFNELGWEIIYAEREIDGDPALLGRNEQTEVILTRFLLPALRQLNPDLPSEGLDQAVGILNRDRSTMSLAKANQDVYKLLKNGVVVSYRDEKGVEKTKRVRLINWEEPELNRFLLVSQLWVNGPMYRKRPDLVGFVNGIPLLLVELKESSVNLHHAYQDNLRDYRDTITLLLWYNGIVLLSNGREAKAGSVTAPWGHFGEWKKISDEDEDGIIDLDTMIRAICPKERLLDIVENFTVFQEAAGGLIKLVAKNHQYLGVANAIQAVDHVRHNEGRLGVFWHTQGAGKSASMLFFSQKVLRKAPGNWTFVIITDRTELDDQIYETFQNSGIIKEGHVQATSSRHLRKLLTEDHRYVFTLIHKFRTEEGETHPVLSDRDDIIIITDEAHRSQYDILAQNMRDALPNAAFIGFTGTPLIKGEEEKTREVFGEYVSVYNFRQSIEDRATVPLYYENRIPEVQLTVYGEEYLNDEMNLIIEEALLDPEKEDKLEREFSRMYHVITREDRLDKIAEDIVQHFVGRGHRGKAMHVAIDKATAVKMYDKVKVRWEDKIKDLERRIPYAQDDELLVLKDDIEFMEKTDMAVVISPGQNEVDDMRKKGVDIRPHRMRMVNEDLDKKFKDPDDPFRIVFVCAMWMTGFDVPSCSTIYLDKPMRNHTLMQTIARANRVFEDKTNGIIVDYVGVFRNLEKALAIYGAGKGSEDPIIKNKDELKSQLIQAIEEINSFLEPLGVNLEIIRKEKNVLKRVALKDEAGNCILINDDTKKEFLRRADIIRKIYRAYLPDPVEPEIRETAYLIRKLAKQIRSLDPEVDISDVMLKVDALLDQSVEGFSISEPEGGWKHYDLSKIDFEELRAKYEKGRNRIVIEQLRKSVESKLNLMIAINQTRMDFRERLQEIINEYNHPTVNLDEIFKKLLELSQDLKDEEKRYIREELGDEEELAVFDLLTKPDMDLSQKEIKQVKGIARQLLEKLRTEKMVLDWKRKQQTRAGVKLTIAETLDLLPLPYANDVYDLKCDMIYQYVYGLE